MPRNQIALFVAAAASLAMVRARDERDRLNRAMGQAQLRYEELDAQRVESWKSMDELVAQLAAIEVRYGGKRTGEVL